MDPLQTLAMEVIPGPALKAILGLGLIEATNWSLRAAGKRTTLLLVWDKEEKEDNRGEFKCRKNRKRKRRETGPEYVTRPPTPVALNEISLTRPEKKSTAQWDNTQEIQEQLEVLTTQLRTVLTAAKKAEPIAPETEVETQVEPKIPTPPPKKKKGKGKQRAIVTSTPSTPPPSLAINLDKKFEETTTSREGKWESPVKTARMPKEDREKLMTKHCTNLGLAKLLENKKKATSFISAVIYIGFRSLQTSPPRTSQWLYAIRILTSYYYDAFEEQPFRHLFDAAAYIATRHGLYFPRVTREEEKTAAQIVEREGRRGTFQIEEFQPY